MSETILELRDITKIFPGVKALDKVQFSLKKGEIHALMGENGAGKSTFIKVITGVHEPNEGKILLNGKEIIFKTPKDAQNNSIAAIYQHGTTYTHLSITENIFIGHEELIGLTKRINWKSLHAKAEKILLELGCEIDPRTIVSQLTVAEQQIVEIAKAISANAQILIMDEPTASLSKRECDNLYYITDKLKNNGVSIIFISHRFEDMYRLAERVTVLRDGKYIGTWGVNGIKNNNLIHAMVGREIEQVFPHRIYEKGRELLRIEDLERIGYFKNINFTLYQGEILGFAGLVGAGRTEIMQCIFGIEPLKNGKIYLDGKEIKINKPLDAMKHGIGLVPEDRQKQGLVLPWEIYKNVSITDLEKFTKNTIVKQKEEQVQAKILGEKMALKAPTVFEKVSSLSGGNQQKVVICKLLNTDLKILILDEPTKGVDVGAKSQIYEIIDELAKKGYGIIMISSDMSEILGMSDRILTVYEGKITGEFYKNNVTQEEILEAAMGKEVV
ncbi:MAG: sugar ABC transporter ATP-binding protein [Lachnospirales bacterium]